MRKHFIALLFLLILVNLNTSCSKKKYENTPLSSEWLLPLVKSNISTLTLTTLKDKEFVFGVTAEDLGLSSTEPSSSPIPLTFTNIGPFPIETNDLIHSIELDTCIIRFRITNNFPITIKAGTSFYIKSNVSPDPFFTMTFSNDIGNGSSEEFHLDLTGREIGKDLVFFFENITIGAYENQVLAGSLEFNCLIEQLSVRSVTVAANQVYVVADTSDFDGQSISYNEYDERIDDSMVRATIYFKGENELPINLTSQIYFIDDAFQVLDSVFTPHASIVAATYNGPGSYTPQKSSFETFIPKYRLENIKKATKMVNMLQFDSYSTASQNVTITNEQKLFYKVISDVKFPVNPSLF